MVVAGNLNQVDHRDIGDLRPQAGAGADDIVRLLDKEDGDVEACRQLAEIHVVFPEAGHRGADQYRPPGSDEPFGTGRKPDHDSKRFGDEQIDGAALQPQHLAGQVKTLSVVVAIPVCIALHRHRPAFAAKLVEQAGRPAFRLGADPR